jgi:high-affinity iron transporter
VTALVAVAVLLYVSHWLFQKTYIHDWKAYLEEHLGRAVTRGSALAMAGLAFAAVYREGFETVLFYQALMFDAGAGAVLAGFVPGILVIAGIGYGIVKLGLRLPLKRVFAVTGSVLLYLAFVFLGKGLYNLQEASLFAPHPLPWIPDHEALRQLLGLYPLAETILAQSAFLLLLGAGALWLRARRPRAAAPDGSDASRPGPAAARPPRPEPAESRR